MAKLEKFSVSKKGFKEFEVTANLPENLEDPRWLEIVSDGKQDIHELALRSFVINAQGRARGALDENMNDEANAAAVQQAVDTYVYGARGGGFQRPTLSAEKAKEQGFTKEQLAMLASLGVNVEAMAAPANSGAKKETAGAGGGKK